MPAVPASLRLANQSTLLEHLLERKAASRADLAKATGMSQPTAGKIIDDLVNAGVVEELGRGDGARRKVGRPGKQLRLATSKPRFVVIELGVEWTRIAALPPAPPETERWETQFRTPASESAWSERLLGAAERIDIKRPWAVLMSAPGIIDERQTRVLLSPNIHWSEQADLPWIVRQAWHSPFGLVQEARALALGELGARSDGDDFLLIDIGDGVGSAVMLARRLYQGALPISGELGHTPILGNARPCGCGGRGCLETLVSERGLVQSLREASGATNASFGEVIAASENEVPPWMRAAFDATAMCAAAALNMHGVRRVILTGRITELPSIATDYLLHAVQRTAMWSRFDAVAVTLAPRRRSRGLVVAGIHRFVMPADWGRSR
jgi:predicted NBD/HSP70 family sugar kinase